MSLHKSLKRYKRIIRGALDVLHDHRIPVRRPRGIRFAEGVEKDGTLAGYRFYGDVLIFFSPEEATDKLLQVQAEHELLHKWQYDRGNALPRDQKQAMDAVEKGLQKAVKHGLSIDYPALGDMEHVKWGARFYLSKDISKEMLSLMEEKKDASLGREVDIDMKIEELKNQFREEYGDRYESILGPVQRRINLVKSFRDVETKYVEGMAWFWTLYRYEKFHLLPNFWSEEEYEGIQPSEDDAGNRYLELENDNQMRVFHAMLKNIYGEETADEFFALRNFYLKKLGGKSTQKHRKQACIASLKAAKKEFVRHHMEIASGS